MKVPGLTTLGQQITCTAPSPMSSPRHIARATRHARHLNAADEVTSGRFMGAIASIMLLPTFIVGLYGMNFDNMPELRWPIGYGFAASLIVAITMFQIWYFRRKRWL